MSWSRRTLTRQTRTRDTSVSLLSSLHFQPSLLPPGGDEGLDEMQRRARYLPHSHPPSLPPPRSPFSLPSLTISLLSSLVRSLWKPTPDCPPSLVSLRRVSFISCRCPPRAQPSSLRASSSSPSPSLPSASARSYTSDIGESFRPVVPPWVVTAGVS